MHKRLCFLRCRALFVSLCSALQASGVLALPFQVNEDIVGVWNNSIVAASVIRARDPDKQLVGFNDAPEYPGAKGAVSVADDGNLNYHKGDVVSAPLIYTTDLELRYQSRYGVYGKLSAWYDSAGEDRAVPHGSIANGYRPNEPLDDSDYYDYNQFHGYQVLDLYTYGNWDFGENRFTARLGKQSINWGESLLHIGINGFNPINYSALGRSTVRQDEALIPVNRIYGNLITRNAVSIEAFYALDWTASQLPACGTLGAGIDAITDPACNAGTAATPLTDREMFELGELGSNPYLVARPYAKKPGSSGQFGLSSRYFVEALDTEFGVYYVNYHATNPIVDLTLCDASPCSGATGLGLPLSYHENVQALALSAASGLRNLAYSMELSHFRNLPAQRNFTDMLSGALDQTGIYAQRIAAAAPGSTISGSIPVDRTQLLLGGELDLAQSVGLSDAKLVAEASAQWISNLPGTNEERIGRNANWGSAATADAGCPTLTQMTEHGCSTAGYATDFSWGYRVLASVNLPKPELGLEFRPQLSWSHDVDGYSVDSVQVEGRQVIGTSLRTIFQRAYFVEIGRNWFKRDVDYDPARDKDVYFMAMGLVF